jgi:hypothetical protein
MLIIRGQCAPAYDAADRQASTAETAKAAYRAQDALLASLA